MLKELSEEVLWCKHIEKLDVWAMQIAKGKWSAYEVVGRRLKCRDGVLGKVFPVTTVGNKQWLYHAEESPSFN